SRRYTSPCRQGAIPSHPRIRRASHVRSRENGSTSHVEQDMQCVTVADEILLAPGTHDALLLRVHLAPRAQQLVPADDLGADEATLEVRMDRPGGLLRRGARGDRPRADLVLAGGEEG